MAKENAAVVEDLDDGFFKDYDKVNKKKVGVPGFQMNAPLVMNNLVGINGLELEIEGRGLIADGHLDGVRSPITRAHWVVVNDGSLRNGGLEYRFSNPVLEEEVEGMLDGLFQRLKDAGAIIQLSNRCSVHVHCNMKGKTINQITSILATWGMFEALLIDWCGEQRKTNHFCLSMQDAVSIVDAWNTFLRYGSHHWPEGLKYSAVNILTLWEKGSLEFRCGAGAAATREPLLWTKFLNRMISFAVEKYENPANIAYDISERGGVDIFHEITQDLPEFRAEVMKDMSRAEFNDRVMAGFRTVQPLVLGYPWDEWLGLIKKEYVPNPFVKNKTLKPPAPPRPRARRLEPEAPIRPWAAEPMDEDEQAFERENEEDEFPQPVVAEPIPQPPRVVMDPADAVFRRAAAEQRHREEIANWRRQAGEILNDVAPQPVQNADAVALRDIWDEVRRRPQRNNDPLDPLNQF